MHFRKATVADIPLIRSLTMQIWPSTYIPIIGVEQVNYMITLFYNPASLEDQMRSGHQFILGYKEEVPVAFASWSEIETHIFKLHKLYIIPGHQGKGIGRLMLDQIISAVNASNASQLRLNVNRYNHPAIAFYKKAGFTHLADEDINIGNGYFMNDHVLGLSL